MERRFTLGHGLSQIRKADTGALDSAPPKDGEVIRTSLPDDFNGIRFEIGRMVTYVQAAAKDPIVQNHAANILDSSASMGNSVEDSMDRLENIEAWCREHYVYVNDPPNIEVIQTPRRMVKQTYVPHEVIESIIEPYYEAMEGVIGSKVAAYQPPGICAGDCDEGSMLVLALASTDPEIRPIKFRFGGNDGTLHHVWGIAGINGGMVDSDLTEPDYILGDFSKFEQYEEVEVPL